VLSPFGIQDGSREIFDWPLGRRALFRSRWYMPIFSHSKFITAFGVGVALTAKDHYWLRNVDSVPSALSGYVETPDLLTYNVAIVRDSSA
jgi:hypothetical protein